MFEIAFFKSSQWIGQCFIPWEFVPFCNCPWVEGIPKTGESEWRNLVKLGWLWQCNFFGMFFNCCYFCVVLRACQAKELPLSLTLLFFFFHCSPMKIWPGQAEKNEKTSSLYRLRQSTIVEKIKRCVPLRRNVAESPRSLGEWGWSFVLSQLLTCTHESKNMFAFFKSLRFYGEQESVWSNPVKLGEVSFNLVPRSRSPSNLMGSCLGSCRLC